MTKTVTFWSDDTVKGEGGNAITISQREDADIYIKITKGHPTDRTVSIRASGSRHKNWGKIISKFSEIIDLIEEDEFSGARVTTME